MSAMGGERGGAVERKNNGLKRPKLGEKHKILDWRSSRTPNKILPMKFMGRHITNFWKLQRKILQANWKNSALLMRGR